MTKNVVNFNKAERNARKRDFENEKEQFKSEHNGVDQEAVDDAMRLLSQATGKDVYIGTKRSPQSKVRFVQTMQENLWFINQEKYLTNKEKVFLSDITPYIAFSSNCIVQDVKTKNPVPTNISELAKLIGITRANTSMSVNSLVKKGILAKTESGVEGNNAKAYSLFVNPHIMFAGDKDNVNESLKVMFRKSMKMPILKDLPN